MKIEYYSEFDDNDFPIVKKLDIEIDESLPITMLLESIHKLTKIPKYREIKWDGKVEKIACSYYFKNSNEPYDFEMIMDLNKPISDFPKKGSKEELSLFIDKNTGLVN
ncbi:hypothetical protein [Tenacibaculum discolor]|nr:hypothetical protein [Tenacibaculum discolor]MDP2541962.1 hypothetical protein [Tenacibaculum discolor]